MLTLNDLDFESSKDLRRKLAKQDRLDSINEIRNTQKSLGAMSVRDSVEAIYGEEYARQILGDDGGRDILVEELSPSDDIREARGESRTDVGDNRMPVKKLDEMNKNDREDLINTLSDQEVVVEKAVEDSITHFFREESNLYENQKTVDDINNMLPEERAQVIQQLLEQAHTKK